MLAECIVALEHLIKHLQFLFFIPWVLGKMAIFGDVCEACRTSIEQKHKGLLFRVNAIYEIV